MTVNSSIQQLKHADAVVYVRASLRSRLPVDCLQHALALVSHPCENAC